MDKYQISRVLKVFDGSSFECVINLGMGVYLKKTVVMTDIYPPSPDSLNNQEKLYGIRARDKLKFFTRKTPIYIEIDKYHDDCVYGKVYTEDFDDSLNYIMFLKGYVWEKGDENKDYQLFVLNSLSNYGKV
jgi:hypothetical protein